MNPDKRNFQHGEWMQLGESGKNCLCHTTEFDCVQGRNCPYRVEETSSLWVWLFYAVLIAGFALSAWVYLGMPGVKR